MIERARRVWKGQPFIGGLGRDIAMRPMDQSFKVNEERKACSAGIIGEPGMESARLET
jgi:hypothetical protein